MKKHILFLLFIELLYCSSLAIAQETKDSMAVKTFELGEVIITGRSEIDITSEMKSANISVYQKHSVSSALDLLPGVTLSQAGARNEAMVYLRGYDLRQVPVFIDGMPVYVPYDGYIDLARLQTANVDKISLSKGFSSMLYGANSMGGAINIVTSKPVSKLEISGLTGTSLSTVGTNNYNTSLNLGSKMDEWYFLANFSVVNRNYMSLPSSFETNEIESEKKRNNSYTKDVMNEIKIGFEPKAGHEYVLSYSAVRSKKGVPVYMGNNPSTKARYWQYPDWDKDCFYLHTKSPLSEKYILKTRWFYDKYYNVLKSFDDDTYSSQEKKFAFTSIYDDRSFGGSVELGIYSIPQNELKIAINSKYDHHQEYDEGGTPQNFKDNTVVVALEDMWTLSQNFYLIGGVGYYGRFGIEAKDYDSETDSVYPFDTPNDNALNYQAGLFFTPGNNKLAYITIARKSRFATMKDRYSYRLGTALPNPDLESEHSINTEIGFKGSNRFIQWHLAGFYNFINNTIQQVNNVEPGLYQLQNTGEAEFRGAECNIGWKVHSLFTIGSSYSFIDQNNISNPEIKFIDVPKHKLTCFIKIEEPGNYYAVLDASYNSERFSTSDGIYKAPAFTLINLNAEYFFLNYFSVRAGLHNILDKLYYVTEGYPEEGQTFNISLTYNFAK
jgi:iron complex outermembrane recepter protein